MSLKHLRFTYVPKHWEITVVYGGNPDTIEQQGVRPVLIDYFERFLGWHRRAFSTHGQGVNKKFRR